MRSVSSHEAARRATLGGAGRAEVHEAIGLTFARVLRHDPNVILAGAIRGEETAEIACRAA